MRLIDDILLLGDNESPPDSEGWTKSSTSLRRGVIRVEPLYLWYHTSKTSAEMSADEKANIITELDIIYGDDMPWYGFERIEPMTLPSAKFENTWLTIRRGIKPPPAAPPLHFSHDGKFKIMQIADLHFSVSAGSCRDTGYECNNSDNKTQDLLSAMLDAEMPDLVVFTGDQLNGQQTSYDPKSVLAKFARSVTDRQIPWAAVFGNHDSEIGASRAHQMQMMKALPYSVVEPGPQDIHGVGNYLLKVKSADACVLLLKRASLLADPSL